jgi:phytoene dehydrogenase-like protein
VSRLLCTHNRKEKLDWALDGPIPWRDPRCLEASTVHLGGTLDEIAAGEAAVWRGEHPERPFVLLVQQSHACVSVRSCCRAPTPSTAARLV